MAASVDPLVVGRVIGDVVDMFVPAVKMSVYYGSKHVSNGCDIKPSLSVDPPKVTISGHSDELYTLVRFLAAYVFCMFLHAGVFYAKIICTVLFFSLFVHVDLLGCCARFLQMIIHISNKLMIWFLQVMTDPDAPSPSEPRMREWVHWYVLLQEKKEEKTRWMILVI